MRCYVNGSASLVVAAAVMMMFLAGCETTKHAEVMSAEELAKQAQVAGLQDAGKGTTEQEGIPLPGQGISEGSLSVGEVEGAETSAPSGISESSLSAIEPEGPPLPTLRAGEEIPESQPAVSEEMIAGVSEEEVFEGGTGPGGTTKSALSDAIAEYPTGGRGPSAFFGPESPPQAYLREGVEPTPMAPAGEPAAPGGEPTGPMEGEVTELPGEAGPSGYEGEQFVRALTPSDFVPEGPPQPRVGEMLPAAQEPGKVGERAPVTTPEAGPAEEPVRGEPGPSEEIVRLPQQPPAEEGRLEPVAPGDFGAKEEEGEVPGLSHVFFDFDQFVIRADAIPTLQANAQLLNAKYHDSNVLIEGHCDERGTSEYNLVLGERRAQAVKNYLADLGVSPSRIKIISYGKERPFCTVSEEWCWQKNRRGHFVLQ